MASEGQVHAELVDFVASNNICADCNAPEPRWASTNLGILVCIECSGVHRNLGTHISKMRSTILDDWTPELLAEFKELGNAKANAKWEHTVPEGYPKPHHNTQRAEREDYIRNKYERQLFVEGNTTPARSEEDRLKAIKDRASPSSSSNIGMIEYVGTVCVKLLSGKNLPAMDTNGKADPYVVLSLGPQTVKSKVIKKSLSPEWKETLFLCVPALGEKMQVVVMDWDRMSSDDTIGTAEVEITEELKDTEITIPLTNKKNKGEITVVMSYESLGH